VHRPVPADDAQDFACGGLLLERFVELAGALAQPLGNFC
jgi:hypothetical protein